MNLLKLTRELIDIPSVTGDELAVGEYLSKYLEELGYQVERQEVARDRFNVIAMRSKTPRQSPASVWRNRRIEGYHGLSSRPSRKRQSGILRNATKTCRPQRASKMRDRRVGCDDQVKMHHDRSGIQKCPIGVEILPEGFNSFLERRFCDLLHSEPLL